jgi:hypothetical protein
MPCYKCGAELEVSQGGFTSRDPAEWVNPFCPKCGYDNRKMTPAAFGCLISLVVVALLIVGLILGSIINYYFINPPP